MQESNDSCHKTSLLAALLPFPVPQRQLLGTLLTDSEKYADVATSGFFSLGHFYGLPNLKMRMLFSFKYPATSLPPSHNAHLSAPLAGTAIVLNIYLVLTVHILLGDVQGSVFRLLFPLFSLDSVSLFSFMSHPQLTGGEFGYHSTVRCCPSFSWVSAR